MNILNLKKNLVAAETASQRIFEIGGGVLIGERKTRKKTETIGGVLEVLCDDEIAVFKSDGPRVVRDEVEVSDAAAPARARGGLLGAWLRQYALAMVITAGLHAALVLFPTSPDGSGAASRTGKAGEDETVGLFEISTASAVTQAQSAGAATSSAAAGEAVSREELSAAAAAQSSEALSQAVSDAEAWAVACEMSGFSADGRGFDVLGAMGEGLKLGSGFEAFGSAGFSPGAVSSGGVVSGRFGNGVAMATFTPEPMYPELARRERREGVVELAVVINASGRASGAEITKSSGHADLDAAARSTVLGMWRFKRGEAGVKRDCVVQIAFSLRRS